MKTTPNKIGIVGSGSWAVALARVLIDNGVPIVWWIRSEQRASFFLTNGFHQNYLPSVRFSPQEVSDYITVSTHVTDIFRLSDAVLLVMPSAFLEHTLSPLQREDWKGKQVVSATKGLMGKERLQIQQYLNKMYNVETSQYMAITGPSHAEEIATHKKTFLTFAASDFADKENLIAGFSSPYIEQRRSHQLVASQYVGVLKNVYAIASGMSAELGFGDNFKSVLVANITYELWQLLRFLSPAEGLDISDFFASNFLGDLFVTCYSEHSRNQRFGRAIAQGKTASDIFEQTKMIAEGYFAAEWVNRLADTHTSFSEKFPIAATISAIIYGKIHPQNGFASLLKNLS